MSRSATACCCASGSGTEIKLDGEELIIIKEADLMGVVEKIASRKAA